MGTGSLLRSVAFTGVLERERRAHPSIRRGLCALCLVLVLCCAGMVLMYY